ncbi:MAG: exodeoxyribonuclease III [Bacteroidia bacterium]|nr:exodeoxyribonuclease III [Bacteroidia bacterium]
MKIITYNINGIRSALQKGFYSWLKAARPDVLCLQEIKAHESQIPVSFFEQLGYHCYWFPAEKKGYSGTAILSLSRPDKVHVGCGHQDYDFEGRVIAVELGGYYIMSVYHPSGSSGQERQDFKMKWLDFFLYYALALKKKHPKLILSGDYNICHKPIDIHDPIRNAKNSGFLPEERAWMDAFVGSGFIDAFRETDSRPHQYTWWSYRANARAKNLGWRIDYHMLSEALKGQIRRCVILSEINHSDHCPVLLEIE